MSCNGDCNQGRSCDCCDGDNHDEMSTSFLAVLVIVCMAIFLALSTGAIAGVVTGFGERIATALSRWWLILSAAFNNHF